MNPIDETDVASYLASHPDFLSRHAELAQQLTMPANQGQAANLASYQLDLLRERNRELTRRMKELLEAGEANELLLHRMHLLSLRLLRAKDMREAVQQVVASMREDFHTPFVRLVLIAMPSTGLHADWLLEAPEQDAKLRHFDEFRRGEHALCGRLRPAMLDYLFAGDSASIASSVLLKLSACGMLAVGSDDSNRFHPGMGTLFLNLMAEQIATAIAVLSERER